MNGAADELPAGSIAVADEELDGLADRSSLLNALDAVQREVRGQAADPRGCPAPHSRSRAGRSLLRPEVPSR